MKNEKRGSSDDESGDEEPTIKDALSYHSQAVSKKCASDLAASRDILFWTLHRQLLRNKHIISVTHNTELVEYVRHQFLITIM